jgi:hypothetical protein
MKSTLNAALKWSTSGSAAYATSGDISNAALYSTPIKLEQVDAYAIQLVTTGATVTGAFKLQASNDNPDREDPDTGLPMNPAPASMNWTDIDGSSATVTVAGSIVWNASAAGYRWVRVVWTESGTATGAVTGRVNGKGPQ